MLVRTTPEKDEVTVLKLFDQKNSVQLPNGPKHKPISMHKATFGKNLSHIDVICDFVETNNPKAILDKFFKEGKN